MKLFRYWSLLLCSATVALAAGDTVALRGFFPRRAAAHLELEQRFDQQLNRDDFRGWIERMSAEPNHVGAPHNRANAEFTLEKFREWGWDARIETFYILYPKPVSVSLELLAPLAYTARLMEPAIAGDRTSGKTRDALPPYNVYGADGDVTADLVYANYGMPDDYAELERRGVSVKGRMVIVRYGGCWRGLKPKLADAHGAVGCVIYSDPRDDGYAAGDVYPLGGYRPPDGVQRGSVLDMPVYPGDPLTPGIGATKDAKRLAPSEARTIMKIPVLPISYRDAQPLLAALGGAVVPAEWRGALPITYHFGPGPARARLAIKSDWSIQPIYNVIATLRGSDFPDSWIIRGNHRDAWVFGAWDPLSGHAAMLAEAKAFGALAKAGWKPKRTLIYASWDAEEPGLIGSTEWVEEHAAELRQKAVAYVNSDTNTRGFLRAGGSPALQALVSEVAARVGDPQLPVSVLNRLRAKFLADGEIKSATEEQRTLARQVAAGPTVPLAALGAGTDFTPFLDHLGISVLSLEYGGEDQMSGCYHSVYDSFDHYERFGDPGHVYGVALAQTVGRVMLQLADADAMPFSYAILADTVDGYVREIKTLAEGMREKTEMRNRLVATNAYTISTDPREPFVPPVAEAPVPVLDLASLDHAVHRLKASAQACDTAMARFVEAGSTRADRHRLELEALWQGMEQALTYENGLPGRSWYRHMVYAPGLLTGYGVKTLPGLREAIEDRRWAEAKKYAAVIADAFGVYADRLDRVRSFLEAEPTSP